MMIAVFIIAGLLLLFYGGDILVDGAVRIAKRLGMSEMLIGITLVGFGTSTPELITSILATFEDKPGIAVGNVVGSNTANIFLILGVAALIYPIACEKKTYMRDGGFMVLAALMALGVCMAAYMNFLFGVLFVLALVAYIAYCVKTEYAAGQAEALANNDGVALGPVSKRELAKDSGRFIFGLLLTFAGARLLVDGSIDLARLFGISETIIGLTIVAVGTSMPELVASAIAAFKRNTGIAFGNIIGSNIYNIFGVLGITAIMMPFAVPQQIIDFDIWVMLGATALLMGFAAWGWTINRWKGAVFLGCYVAYTLALIQMASSGAQ